VIPFALRASAPPHFHVADMEMPPLNSEEKILADMKRDWAETRLFFSNKGKPLRELWIVEEFLTQLQVLFSPTDLVVLDQHDKVDVSALGASFQIKEIPNPDTRRGAEIAATAERVRGARTLDETIGPGFVYDTPQPANGYDLVYEQAELLAASPKYVGFKARLDLLFYVTRTATSMISAADVQSDAIAALGWRSISCIGAVSACVLYASPGAPEFLRSVAVAR
jgi:Putative endonuclease, protein of unknown function (DUF1780)